MQDRLLNEKLNGSAKNYIHFEEDDKRKIFEHSQKSPVRYVESIGSAVLYGVCSTTMAFVNKTIITSYTFDFPLLIMSCQMTAVILFLQVLKRLCSVNIPVYTRELGRSFALPAFFYALHSVSALHALGGMSIPMYAAVKRCAPIVALILSVVVLKKQYPQFRIILAIFLISIGCVLAGFGDLQFDVRAYTYGLLSVLVQGLYLTLAQKSLENEMSAIGVLYLNSFNTLPFFIILTIFWEYDGISQHTGHSDVLFGVCFALQVAMGALLNYTLFLCTEKNSALTTSLVGVVKSVLQTVIGSFTFGGVQFNEMNVIGISLNLFGGILYAYTKYNEKVKNEILKPIIASQA